MGVLEKYANGVAVEFGCGMHSTPLLLEKCTQVMSIEMQDSKWLSTVDKHLIGKGRFTPAWTAVDSVGPWEFLSLYYPRDIDFAFIDGHKASRWACVNLMMMLGVPTIVAHDTEAPQYGWQKVRAGGYTEKVYQDLTPHTTVWTKD